MPPSEIEFIRSQARKDLEGGHLHAAIATLEQSAFAAHAEVQYDLSRLYFKIQRWDPAAAAARGALTVERSLEDTFRLLSAIITSAHKLGRGESLGAESARFLELLERAARRGRETLNIETLEGLVYWQMALAIAFGCGDTDGALKLYRQRDPTICPFAGHAEGTVVSAVTTLAQFCEASGSRHFLVDRPERATFAGGSPHAKSWSYEVGPYAVGVVPNAEFVSGWDFVRTPSGEILADSGYTGLETSYQSFSPHCYFKELGKVGHVWPPSKTHIDRDALFLSTPESYHIGHWIVDFLPRLRALEALGSTELALAVPAGLTRKQRDLLELFGIDNARLIPCDFGKRYSFRTLAVAQIGTPHHPNPQTVCFMSAALRPAVAMNQRSVRLFLNRSTGTRKIVNQPELDRTLEAYGFESIDLARMTIAEQRAKVGAAEIVVGVLGSDLLACFFMAPDSHLIELSWDPKEDAAIGPYSAMLGIHYYQVVGRIAPVQGAKTQKKDRDFEVDLAALRELLERIGVNAPA